MLKLRRRPHIGHAPPGKAPGALPRAADALRSGAMIAGAHTILFAEDAEAARAFLRDVLGLESVDAGDGWLIFALPPGELAVHPGSGWGRGPGHHVLFLMCHDIEATARELEAKGVELVGAIEDEGWGRIVRIRVPGAGELGIYEPRHPSPLAEFGGA